MKNKCLGTNIPFLRYLLGAVMMILLNACGSKNSDLKPNWDPNITDEQRQVIEGIIDNMVHVEGGSFMMGTTIEQDPDAKDLEMPVHKVTLKDFNINRFEVTRKEWKAIMGSDPSSAALTSDKLPVEQVSWMDCQNFVDSLNRLSGLHFRLPYEAEWEFAARGGNQSHGTRFAGSNNLAEVGWFQDNSPEGPKVVGQLRPNELGLYDMSGNVREWCQDWYDTYTDEEKENPKGPVDGSFHLYRGGCWGQLDNYCRVTDRFPRTAYYKSARLGLRLAH